MLKLSLVAFLIAASATAVFAQENGKAHQPTLTPQTSGTTQLLIAVSPVDSRVVWAAGAGGTYVVTTDGGETWTAAVVPGAESLQFRDVYGVSDKIAYLDVYKRQPAPRPARPSELRKRYWRDPPQGERARFLWDAVSSCPPVNFSTAMLKRAIFGFFCAGGFVPLRGKSPARCRRYDCIFRRFRNQYLVRMAGLCRRKELKRDRFLRGIVKPVVRG